MLPNNSTAFGWEPTAKDADGRSSVGTRLEWINHLNFNLSKSKVTNLYRDVSAVHLNSTEASPQAAQRQRELQEGYSVVSEIYSALYGEDWNAGHSYESFVKGLKNYNNIYRMRVRRL